MWRSRRKGQGQGRRAREGERARAELITVQVQRSSYLRGGGSTACQAGMNHCHVTASPTVTLPLSGITGRNSTIRQYDSRKIHPGTFSTQGGIVFPVMSPCPRTCQPYSLARIVEPQPSLEKSSLESIGAKKSFGSIGVRSIGVRLH